ncbi:hyccin, partial [Biomphalaria glabrata]
MRARNPDEVNEGGVKMLTRPIKDWLSEYKGLSNNEVLSFACGLSVNEELISDLFTLFETPPFYVQELDPVCHQLYEFYRSKDDKLKRFALQFVPTLIWLYLRCLSLGQKKVCGGVETLLLGVYNL